MAEQHLPRHQYEQEIVDRQNKFCHKRLSRNYILEHRRAEYCQADKYDKNSHKTILANRPEV